MSTPDPAKLLGTAEIMAVQEEGRKAALAGDHPRNCPYREATNPYDKARRQMWIRGYSAGRTDLRHGQ